MTVAEEFNQLAGRKVIAEQLDAHGLPDGGWAIPRTVAKSVARDRRTVVTCSTFRVVSHDKIERAGVQELISNRDLESDPTLLETAPSRLIPQLLDSLSIDQ